MICTPKSGITAWTVFLLFTGCGEDGLLDSDPGSNGRATVTGRVASAQISPNSALVFDVFGVPVMDLEEVENGTTCEDASPDDRRIVIGFPCGPIKAGTFAVGSVTIELANDNVVVVGKFAASFGEQGSLEGSATAIVCDSTPTF